MALEAIKKNLFVAPMPDMPELLRELWQAAYLLRRKYSNPAEKDVEAYFSAAWSDAQFIVQQFGGWKTAQALMMEVYEDIERQWKAHYEKTKNTAGDADV